MSAARALTMKPGFADALSQLTKDERHLVHEKMMLLASDPEPTGKFTKRLTNWDPPMFRARAGNLRIFYTFGPDHVSLRDVRRRNEDTYTKSVDLDPDEEPLPVEQEPRPRPVVLPAIVPAAGTEDEPVPLQRAITVEMLTALGIPERFHATLTAISTLDELIACNTVPQDLLTKVMEEADGRRVPEGQLPGDQAPDLIVPDRDQLEAYAEGALEGFLLKLDPEQEPVVKRALEGKGPSLVKGGPGSGKSTVALYRIRELLEILPVAPRPRILFTTYTNALIRFSKQLLDQLLGEHAPCVEVQTADSLAMGLVSSARKRGKVTMLDAPARERLLAEALKKAPKLLEGNAAEKAAQLQTLERLGADYLLAEIQEVIEGRDLREEEHYLEAKRPGRQTPLNRTQRRAVWAVASAFRALLTKKKAYTWERLRAEAGELATAPDAARYDAVIVDEAQDLSPTALRMLATLCKDPTRLFVTADANQSIYGGSFNWSDVHEDLSFRGRTAILRTNHRTTRQIAEAARAYLSDGGLDLEGLMERHRHEGPKPAFHRVADTEAELAALARFLPRAARDLRLPLATAAVLTATTTHAKRLAEGLCERGLEATHMTGKDLDLARPTIKVLTTKSAKGLEFPIVALVGSSPLPATAPPEDLTRERRTLFVSLTRAMRALLWLAREGDESPLLHPISAEHWVP